MEKLCLHTDEQLVALYVSGQNEAFDVLLERYKDKLYSYIFYIIKNADLADDLFQETFVKAIMTIKQGRYVENGKFYPWLTRIAHNLLIDQFRNERNENTVSNDEVEGDLFNNCMLSDDSTESVLVYEQSLKDVKKLMDHLPENQREVVFMRYYQDLSFKEISDITGVSINTALGRMRYAILNMRRMAQENNIALCGI
ncbi:MAG: sigma-70 family RNA polymerase sigma factor [Bacteroidaceae bacterium]|nr:sigma-70 family RNA polymerase sigma factor [Bacteroidaceae bacterium]